MPRRLTKMTGPNREASNPLAIQIQGRAVQVALRRLHRSDIVPARVHADERLLREFLGLGRTSGQEQTGARKPRVFAAEEVAEILGRRPHIDGRTHPYYMNP